MDQDTPAPPSGAVTASNPAASNPAATNPAATNPVASGPGGTIGAVVAATVVPPRRGLRARRRGSAAAGAPLVVLALGLVIGLTIGQALPSERNVTGAAQPAAPAAGPTTPLLPTGAAPAVQPVYKLADHPMLGTGVTLPAVACTLPRFARDVPSLREYYGAFVDCLDEAWRPVLKAAGLPFSPPRVNLSQYPGNTGCGGTDDGAEFTALYCPVDRTLYLPTDRLIEVDRGRPASHLAIVGHEYAHHVQELSGLLDAANRLQHDVGRDTPAGQDVNRRIELQANCFSGLFLAAAAGRASIPRGLAEQAVLEFTNGGLPDSHGSRIHQAEWASTGYRTATTAACNTWSALPTAVT